MYLFLPGIIDPSQASGPPGNVADMPVLYGPIKKQISQARCGDSFSYPIR